MMKRLFTTTLLSIVLLLICALAALPTAGNTVSNRFSDTSK